MFSHHNVLQSPYCLWRRRSRIRLHYYVRNNQRWWNFLWAVCGCYRWRDTRTTAREEECRDECESGPPSRCVGAFLSLRIRRLRTRARQRILRWIEWWRRRGNWGRTPPWSGAEPSTIIRSRHAWKGIRCRNFCKKYITAKNSIPNPNIYTYTIYTYLPKQTPTPK